MTNHNEDYEVVKPMATFDKDLESIVTNVLQLPLDNAIPLAIHQAGVSTWQQFMFMDEDDVFDIECETAAGKKFLTKYEQKLLSWFIGYVRSNIDDELPGSDKPSFYSKEDFTKYTQERRKICRLKARYSTTRATRDAEKKKTLEEHVVDLASKVKKTTTEILDQLKEAQRKQKEAMQKQKERMSTPNAATSENQNKAAAPSA